MRKILIVLLFVVSFVHAEVKDKFKISLGVMYVSNFETEMQVAPKGFPIGLRINTKDQLKMKNDTGVFRLDGYYRFNDTHGIDFSYFSVNSDGYTGGSIEWNDTNISSASIQSYFNMDIYKVNYAYSFYHNEKVELALTAGLHVTAMELGIAAYGTIDGVSGSTYKSGTSVTVPLPVFGFKGEYTIIDKRFFVNYKADYFFLSIDDYKGALVTTSLNFEYRFVDNFGLGVGYNANNIRIEADGDNARADVVNTLSGAMFYLSYIY
jgi:hypothetical protein